MCGSADESVGGVRQSVVDIVASQCQLRPRNHWRNYVVNHFPVSEFIIKLYNRL